MKRKTPTDFSRMSKTDVAKAKKVSLNTVYGWIRRGCQVNDDGTLDLQQVDQFLSQRERAATAPGSLEAERARLAKEQADKLEMENAISRGEMIFVEDAAAHLEEIIVAVKAKVMSLKAKIPPNVIGCGRLPEIEAIVERECHAILREIAQIDDGRNGGPARSAFEAAPAGAASSAADGERVGGST